MKISVDMDRFLPQRWRLRIRGWLFLSSTASFVTSLFSSDRFFDGLSLLLFGLFGVFLVFEFFYNSSKFSKAPAEYSVAVAIFEKEKYDLTKRLLLSPPGKILVFRAGLSFADLETFLNSERTLLSENDLDNLEEAFVFFRDYVEAIFEKDATFSSFVSNRGLSREEFLGTAAWVGTELSKELKEDAWWSREALDQVSSLGTSLDYGSAYELSLYSKPLYVNKNFFDTDLDHAYRAKEVSQLENILARAEEANAIIVDDDESVAEEILTRLLSKIRSGSALPTLEHKGITKLDTNLLVANKREKSALESEIISIFSGAEYAGDKIIYIPNLPSFIGSAKSLGVNLSSLLEDYMKSRNMHIVAHSTKTDFHYMIETSALLTRMFERLIPEQVGVAASMPPLTLKARIMEGRSNILFSYPSLLAIAESADRYVPLGEMPSKAIDLLLEVIPWAKKHEISILQKSHVLEFISAKTGIATGEISKEEGERLEKLEKTLHERVVGQEEAISAISNAMRRARSGLANPKRPFASFLFLGPTGVGKTETSKALAGSFFSSTSGGEGKMIRFDMSQYKEADALPALVGSVTLSTSGLLSTTVRDHPYGVLLLDEFEKASPDVRDLFLQVLDEGEYIDALGNKVNCRNLIIIATSNAGSDLIWKMVEGGEDLNKNKDKIVDLIIENRIYKPELINRFDGVVIFHPLKQEELAEVASMMFKALAERIKKEKQIDLKISPELLEEIISKNESKEFGARSINRLIQEKIEDLLARKIISGEVKSGSTFEIKKEDVMV